MIIIIIIIIIITMIIIIIITIIGSTPGRRPLPQALHGLPEPDSLEDKCI